MEMDISKKAGILMCVFLIISSCDNDDGPAGVFGDDSFFEEFSTANIFNDLDDNNDGFLDNAEFIRSHFETWDIDNSGVIEETEFNTAVADFNITDATWNTWDFNENGVLDFNEFDTGFSPYNFYNTWDVDPDTVISEREYSDGIFALWDSNNDGLIEESEYERLKLRYYGI